MTLGTRLVAALILVALIPMAVVLAITLVSADKRARDETERRREQARKQATILVEDEHASFARAADRAAEDLASDRSALAAVVHGPESLAKPAARGLGERFALARVTILSQAGSTLADVWIDQPDPDGVGLIEMRRVHAGEETLTLATQRWLGNAFAARVAAITGGEARFPVASCDAPSVEVPVIDGAALCIGVTPADVAAVRRDLLRSFAGVAPVAFVAALLVGLVLASRIARPIEALAVRAEGISAQQSHPITLLPEKDETRRLTLAFDQMLDALSASERQRLAAERAAAWEEIARRLAHEIKNPLSPIQLAVENLRRTRERAPEAFDRAFQEETATILEEVASLRALVDEFAQFARLPRPRVAPCDPRAVASQALALFAGRIETEGVRVTVDDALAPATIQADAEQIGRVLKNVLANALDAMESSQERVLTLSLRAEAGHAVVSVRDTGAGFDAEALRRVFEPYFTTRGDRGGTGLGMAIAHRIALEHGGSIRAEGSAGRGATVTLTIPIAGPHTGGA